MRAAKRVGKVLKAMYAMSRLRLGRKAMDDDCNKEQHAGKPKSQTEQLRNTYRVIWLVTSREEYGEHVREMACK